MSTPTTAERCSVCELYGGAHTGCCPNASHVREATTDTTLLGEGEPGFLLADCSCGDTYTVPQGGDEYAALEAAHARHVAEAVGAVRE